MKKIPTMFERDWSGDPGRVLLQPNPDCNWVFDGQGIATKKLDGTCCLIRAGRLYRRHEVKPGKDSPSGFEEANCDPTTGKRTGWVPIGDGPEDKWHRQAFEALADKTDGTYEMVGPHTQGNPEQIEEQMLVPHTVERLEIPGPVPRDYDGLKAYLAELDIEGIVFHHPDGRFAKIKKRDFGLKRKAQ